MVKAHTPDKREGEVLPAKRASMASTIQASTSRFSNCWPERAGPRIVPWPGTQHLVQRSGDSLRVQHWLPRVQGCPESSRAAPITSTSSSAVAVCASTAGIANAANTCRPASPYWPWTARRTE